LMNRIEILAFIIMILITIDISPRGS